MKNSHNLKFFLVATISLLFLSTSALASGGNWGRRMGINITNNANYTLYDYPVPINITYDPDMQSDFDDIRFMDGSNKELDYWLELKNDGNWAYFWVKVPAIPTGTNQNLIYVYYNNSEANSTSNGNQTFIWFDDFTTNRTSFYTTFAYALKPTLSLGNGYLNITGNNNDAGFYLNSMNFTNVIVGVVGTAYDMTGNVQLGATTRFNAWNQEIYARYTFNYGENPYGQFNVYNYWTSTGYCSKYVNQIYYPNYTYIHLGVNVSSSSNLVNSTIFSPQLNDTLSCSFTETASGTDARPVGVWMYGTGTKYRIISFFIANYTNPEPTYSIGNEERIYSLTDCGITLNESGQTYYLINNINTTGTGTCFYITNNHIVLDCQGHTIQGTGSGTGIFISDYYPSGGYSNITIKNCNISSFQYGIWGASSSGIRLASYLNITNNTFNNVGFGIGGWRIINSVFSNNSFFGSFYKGFYLDSYLAPNYITNTIISGTYTTGISLSDTAYVVITNATITGRGGSTGISLGCNNCNISNVIVNNHTSGILFLDGPLYVYSNNDIRNITSYNNTYGIYFINTNYNNVSQSTIYNNTYGIYFAYGDFYNYNNTISNSKIYNNNYGISLWENSSHLTKDNRFYNNLLNQTNNTYFCNWNGTGCNSTFSTNYWNTTRQEGTRIYGIGQEIGGNFWALPNGTGFSQTCPSAFRWICRNAYTLTSNNFDYLPLAMNCYENYTLNLSSFQSCHNSTHHILNTTWYDQNECNWTYPHFINWTYAILPYSLTDTYKTCDLIRTSTTHYIYNDTLSCGYGFENTTAQECQYSCSAGECQPLQSVVQLLTIIPIALGAGFILWLVAQSMVTPRTGKELIDLAIAIVVIGLIVISAIAIIANTG